MVFMLDEVSVNDNFVWFSAIPPPPLPRNFHCHSLTLWLGTWIFAKELRYLILKFSGMEGLVIPDCSWKWIMFSILNIAPSSVGWLWVSCASEPLEEAHNYYFISNSSRTIILPSIIRCSKLCPKPLCTLLLKGRTTVVTSSSLTALNI
jgi:hypothetical protein